MSGSTGAQKTVVVLGMHRSGTSLVAGILSRMEVDMGKKLLPKDRFNLRGYYEDTEFLRLNQKILKHCNGDWDNPPQPETIRACTAFTSEIQSLIQNRHGRWGWKDPRTALTLELFLPYLADLQVVVCWRNPYDIAKSLQERDGFDFQRALRLTYTYYQRILEFLDAHPNLPRLMVSFERVRQDPLAQAKELATFLRMELTDAAVQQISAFTMTNDAIREERERIQREKEQELTQELRQANDRCFQMQQAKIELQNIYRSRSWKLLGHVRRIKNLIRLNPRPPQAAPAAAGSTQPATLAAADSQWYKAAVGGLWEEVGQLQFDFLVQQGLQPHHHLLDIGCGSMRGGVRFIRYLRSDHYFGVDKDPVLLWTGRQFELEPNRLLDKRPTLKVMENFDFQALRQQFDYAIAVSVFTHIPLNQIIQCLRNVASVLVPGGKLFATIFESPSGAAWLKPQVNRCHDGTTVTTYPTQDPFHYDLRTFEQICQGTDLQCTYLGEWQHPRNQKMLVFTKRTNDHFSQ
ncbi:MAG: sulfotransferase [Patescibacteria group bacterium]|nr:sulfotransferase [Patescibacteria group bacterium]